MIIPTQLNCNYLQRLMILIFASCRIFPRIQIPPNNNNNIDPKKQKFSNSLASCSTRIVRPPALEHRLLILVVAAQNFGSTDGLPSLLCSTPIPQNRNNRVEFLTVTDQKKYRLPPSISIQRELKSRQIEPTELGFFFFFSSSVVATTAPVPNCHRSE